MTAAEGLVRNYLVANGYFTVAIDASPVQGWLRVCMLAVRLRRDASAAEPIDLTLRRDVTRDDLLVVEIDDGALRCTDAPVVPKSLISALTRSGGIARRDTAAITRQLLQTGSAATATGGAVRSVVFGASPDRYGRPVTVSILLSSVRWYLECHATSPTASETDHARHLN